MSRVDERLACMDCGADLARWDKSHPDDSVTLCTECLETWVRSLPLDVTFGGAEKFGPVSQPLRDGRPVWWFRAA